MLRVGEEACILAPMGDATDATPIADHGDGASRDGRSCAMDTDERASRACCTLEAKPGCQRALSTPPLATSDSAPSPVATTAANAASPPAPPLDVVGLHGGPLAASEAAQPGCLNCNGNHRFAHTCGKRRSRPAIEAPERSRRQRTSSQLVPLAPPPAATAHASRGASRPADRSAAPAVSPRLPIAQPPTRSPSGPAAHDERKDGVALDAHAVGSDVSCRSRGGSGDHGDGVFGDAHRASSPAATEGPLMVAADDTAREDSQVRNEVGWNASVGAE